MGHILGGAFSFFANENEKAGDGVVSGRLELEMEIKNEQAEW